ncbi:MAG: hypothetical protein L6R37_006942 [Teloschistes peruensis]|nr:MAG: hypothetical protein L6R37_006942 [Teloschistes peruensis]
MPRFHFTEKGITSPNGKGDNVRDGVTHAARGGRPQHGRKQNWFRSLLGLGRVNRQGNDDPKGRFVLESPTPSPKDVSPACRHEQSPSSLQQIHFAPDGTAHPLYVNASTQWSRTSAVRPGGNIIERAVEGDQVSAYAAPALVGPSRDEVVEDPPVRNYKAYEPHAVPSHSSSSSFSSCGRTLNNVVPPPDWQFDAEANLHQILRQKSRKYDLTSVAEDSSVPPGPPRPREGGNKPTNRAKKRYGRIFDGDVDYSRLSTARKFELAGSAPQQLVGDEGRQREEVPSRPRSRPRPRPRPRYTLVVDTSTPSNDPPSPLVPARRALPHAPSQTTPQIQARIYDAQSGERLPAVSGQRNQDYRVQPQIRIAHFSPIIGGGPQQSSPLNFDPPPSHPPGSARQQPSPPTPAPSAQPQPPTQPRNNQRQLSPHLLASLIFTDQEFPRALNRDAAAKGGIGELERLTVKTREWAEHPFPGSWVEMFEAKQW